VGILWLGANAWGSLPVHDGARLATIAMWALLAANPLLFGVYAWFGWTRRSILIGAVWPALIVFTWVLMPAVGAGFTWGWGVFAGFIVRTLRLLFWAYLGVHALIYCVVLLVAVRLSRARPPQRTGRVPDR
jgi:hypothetical protein